jgi:hypothetical protein
MNDLKKELQRIDNIESTQSVTITSNIMNTEGRFYRLLFAHGPITIVFNKKRYTNKFKDIFSRCLFSSGCTVHNPVIDIKRVNMRLIDLNYYKYFYIKGENVMFSGDITNIPELFNYLIKDVDI